MGRALALTILVFATACSRPASRDENPPVSDITPHPADEAEGGTPVGFEMRHVRMHSASDIILNVAYLSGQLMPLTRELPVFDDPKSYYIAVDSAEIALDASSLTALVTRVFSYDGSPLSDLNISIHDGLIEQKGKLHKGITVPFSVTATVAARDGRILLHPTKVRAAGIPAAKMMSAFGLELEDLIKVRSGRGVTIRDNDLMLEPGHVTPAPEVRGVVSAAAVSGDRLVLHLGRREPPPAPRVNDSDAVNYLWFHGGRIRFGRLTMANADLQLIDAEPSDPFDFYAERYNDQLVAGYSRNTRDGALRTVMPDFADIPKLAHGRVSLPPVNAKRRSQPRPAK